MMCVKTSEADSCARAASLLNAGGVVVVPTDTVYGLAAHPRFPDAVQRLYTIKNRAAQKPIALLASDATAVAQFGYDVPEELAHYWPGALTVVAPCRVKDASKAPFEGFRVPDHAWLRQVLARCGGVLRVTSANLSGARAATHAAQALASVGLSADLLVDDGPSRGGVPSTVVRVLPTGAREILRPGPIVLTL